MKLKRSPLKWEKYFSLNIFHQLETKDPFIWCNIDCNRTVSHVNTQIGIHATHSGIKLLPLLRHLNTLWSEM